MTDPRAVATAEKLLTDLIQLVDTSGGYFFDTKAAFQVAVKAMADERRRALEEAAKIAVDSIARMVDLYQGKLPYFVVNQDPAVSNDASIALYTADQISKAIRAKAQAGQEGGAQRMEGMKEIKKQPRKRIGCDLCKKDKGTFVFQHPYGLNSNLQFWFCEGCYEVLTGEAP